MAGHPETIARVAKGAIPLVIVVQEHIRIQLDVFRKHRTWAVSRHTKNCQ
jgi:hypothetical protein